MKDKKDRIILGLSVALGLVIIISAGTMIYLVSSNSVHRNYAGTGTNFARGNFTLNNETLTQTESMFSTASSQSDINSYCAKSGNMVYCRYYCYRINPSNSFCSGISMPSGMGAPQQ